VASLVVSYFVALKFADRIAPLVSQHAPWNKFVAMLLIYAGTSLAIWMIYRAIGSAIDRVKLNEFDRQMGALVGFAKGVLFCIAITFFAVTILGQQQRDQILSSRSGRYIVQVLDKADAVAPPEIKQVIGPYLNRINERLDPNYQPNPQQDLDTLRELWQRQANQAGAAVQAIEQAAAAWPPATTTAPNPAPPIWPTTPAQPISNGGDRR
jgi:membrane protein required for colicin V production